MKSDREMKLPKWAQTELQQLRYQLKQRELELENIKSRGPENSNTFLNPYDKNQTPLGKSPRVQFKLPKKDPTTRFMDPYFIVYLQDDGELNLYSTDLIAFCPSAMNTGRLLLLDRH